MTRGKRIAGVVMMVFTIGMLLLPVEAAPYDSYNYVENGAGVEDVRAPAAYLPKDRLSEKDLGITLGEPADLFHAGDGKYYLVDKQQNSVFCFDSKWKLIFTIDNDTTGSNKSAKLNSPRGLFVTAGGEIYVADTDNNRIAIYNAGGVYSREIRLKDSKVLGQDFVFKPQKLVVADGGNLFVVAEGALEGLMEISQDGEFYGYVGSNQVSFNPLELVWRKIFTTQQLEQLVQYVPVEYKNVAMDSAGFLYTVTEVSDVSTPVKRLNQSGDDVLRMQSTLSDQRVCGDLLIPTWYELENYGPSMLTDVVAGSDGLYYILDSKRGRVFCYDEDGNMLFEFGGRNSTQDGMVSTPVALDISGEEILILDSEEKVINTYSMTGYTRALMDAQKLYQNGDYKESYPQWLAVLKQNSNFRIAYNKAGYCLFRQGNYKESMNMYLKGNSRTGYSKAYDKYRQQQLNRYFPFYFAGFAVLVLACVLLVIRHRKKMASQGAGVKYNSFLSADNRVGKQFQFIIRTAAHPLNGFSSIREEGNGSTLGALFCVVCLFISSLLTRQLQAFLFNNNYNSPIDIMERLRLVVIPIVLFIIANWSVTTFMDGKGNMREIFMVVGYSVLPIVIIPLGMAALTQVMTLDEAVFISFAQAISWGWTCILLFIGIQTIHQYSFSKTICCFILTAVSAVIIVFICFLFFSLIQEITGFFYSIYTEIMLRG